MTSFFYDLNVWLALSVGGRRRSAEAWNWLNDPRVEFYPEPRGIEAGFRRATAPFAGMAASEWVGDCYLLAHAKRSHALAGKEGCSAVIPD
jgi:hypothetical protein